MDEELLVQYVQLLNNEIRPPLYQRFRLFEDWESRPFTNPFVPRWSELKLGNKNKSAFLPGVLTICTRDASLVVERFFKILNETPETGDLSGLKTDLLQSLQSCLTKDCEKAHLKGVSQNFEIFLKLILLLQYGEKDELFVGTTEYYGLFSNKESLACFEQGALPLKESNGGAHKDSRLRMSLDRSEIWLFEVVRLIRNEAHSTRPWSGIDLELFKHLVIGGLLVVVDRNFDNLNVVEWQRERETLRKCADNIAAESVLPLPLEERSGLYFRINSDHFGRIIDADLESSINSSVSNLPALIDENYLLDFVVPVFIAGKGGSGKSLLGAKLIADWSKEIPRKMPVYFDCADYSVSGDLLLKVESKLNLISDGGVLSVLIDSFDELPEKVFNDCMVEIQEILKFSCLENFVLLGRPESWKKAKLIGDFIRFDIEIRESGKGSTVLGAQLLSRFPNLTEIRALEMVANCDWLVVAGNLVLVEMASLYVLKHQKYFDVAWVSDRCSEILGKGWYKRTMSEIYQSNIFNTGAGRVWFKHPKFAEILMVHASVSELLEEGVSNGGRAFVMSDRHEGRLNVLYDICDRRNVADEVFALCDSLNQPEVSIELSRIRSEYIYCTELFGIIHDYRDGKSLIQWKSRIVERILLLTNHGSLEDYEIIAKGLVAMVGVDNDDWLKMLVFSEDLFEALMFNPLFALKNSGFTRLMREDQDEDEMRLITSIRQFFDEFWSLLCLSKSDVSFILAHLEKGFLTEIGYFPKAIAMRCADGEDLIDKKTLFELAEVSKTFAYVVINNKKLRTQFFAEHARIENKFILNSLIDWCISVLSFDEFNFYYADLLLSSHLMTDRRFARLARRFSGKEFAKLVLRKLDVIQVSPVVIFKYCRQYWSDSEIDVFSVVGAGHESCVRDFRVLKDLNTREGEVLSLLELYRFHRLGLGDLISDVHSNLGRYVVLSYVRKLDSMGDRYFVQGVRFDWLGKVDISAYSEVIHIDGIPDVESVLVEYGGNSGKIVSSNMDLNLNGVVVGSSRSPSDKWVRVFCFAGDSSPAYLEFYFFDAGLDYSFGDVVSFVPSLNASSNHRMRLTASKIVRWGEAELDFIDCPADLYSCFDENDGGKRGLCFSKQNDVLYQDGIYWGYNIGLVRVPHWFSESGRAALYLVSVNFRDDKEACRLKMGRLKEGIDVSIVERSNAIGLLRDNRYKGESRNSFGVEPGRIMVDYLVPYPRKRILRTSNRWYGNSCFVEKS